ncbi:MAG: 4-alpha-glucanotransferase, partial [Pseudomonadota bacterium]
MKPKKAKFKPVLDRRRSGVLLHPTSLPSGSFGGDAFRFIDFLVVAGFSVWQTLPLGPTHADRSPYHCLSAHALNPMLMATERLVEWRWLSAEALGAHAQPDAALQAARAALRQHADWSLFNAFCEAQSYWLNDYALYTVLRMEQANLPWWDWPSPLRDREREALEAARSRLADQIERASFEQYVLDRQ